MISRPYEVMSFLVAMVFRKSEIAETLILMKYGQGWKRQAVFLSHVGCLKLMM